MTKEHVRLNKRKFHDKATEIILSTLYEYTAPIDLFTATYDDIARRKEEALFAYRNDPLTHARVENIVAMLTQILDSCFEEKT